VGSGGFFSGAQALFGLLRRNADYRRLFFATVVSFLGDWFAFVAVSGFVTEASGEGGLAAVVYAASTIPVFLLSPLAGVIADRMDRRRLMAGVDLLRVLPALAMVLALRWESPALAIFCVALLAALSAFFEPVSAAVVPNLVEPKDLPLAQAAISSLWGSMLFAGAALGGLVAATLGREASFVLNAATFATAALLILRIRRPMQQGRSVTTATVLGHLREVWQLAKERPAIRALIATKGGLGLAGGTVGLLPGLAALRFGGGDAGIGLLLAARGLGALLGPLTAHAVVRGDWRKLLLACGLSMIGFGATYLILPFSPTLWAAAVCVAVAHLGGGAQWMLSTYGLQVSTPDRFRGRVMTLDFGLATLAIGLSSLGAGAAAEVVGLDAAVVGLGLFAIAYGVGWLWWTRRLRGPDAPAYSTSST
jgi:predicted MFS family arabinose efflux permease